MNNKKIRFRTLLVFLAAMTFTLPFLTSCEYFVDVDFAIAHTENDTLDFKGWNGTSGAFYTSPYTSNSGSVYDKTTISSFHTMGGRHTYVSEEQAFIQLMSDFDSVQLTRRSDGASSIIFRHDKNATEAQRYFFTPEAWICYPEGETQLSREYTLILKDEMFK